MLTADKIRWLAESSASARIENEICGLESLIIYELGAPAASFVNEGDYRRTSNLCRASMELRRRPGSRLALDIHRRMFAGTRTDWTPGRFRDMEVVISRGWVANALTGEIERDIVELPPPEEVPGLMAAWDKDAKRLWESPPAIGSVSVAGATGSLHSAFERIHPFPDGNGRTGRALAAAQMGAGVSEVLWERLGEYYETMDHPELAPDLFEEAWREMGRRNQDRPGGDEPAAGVGDPPSGCVLIDTRTPIWVKECVLDGYGYDLRRGNSGRVRTAVGGVPRPLPHGIQWQPEG